MSCNNKVLHLTPVESDIFLVSAAEVLTGAITQSPPLALRVHSNRIQLTTSQVGEKGMTSLKLKTQVPQKLPRAQS